MTIYNGYKDGESRTTKHRPRKADKGHSLVEMTTTRRGSRFAFHYRGTCQCGKSFGSRNSQDRVFYAYDAHLRTIAKEA